MGSKSKSRGKNKQKKQNRPAVSNADKSASAPSAANESSVGSAVADAAQAAPSVLENAAITGVDGVAGSDTANENKDSKSGTAEETEGSIEPESELEVQPALETKEAQEIPLESSEPQVESPKVDDAAHGDVQAVSSSGETQIVSPGVGSDIQQDQEDVGFKQDDREIPSQDPVNHANGGSGEDATVAQPAGDTISSEIHPNGYTHGEPLDAQSPDAVVPNDAHDETINETHDDNDVRNDSTQPLLDNNDDVGDDDDFYKSIAAPASSQINVDDSKDAHAAIDKQPEATISTPSNDSQFSHYGMQNKEDATDDKDDDFYGALQTHGEDAPPSQWIEHDEAAAPEDQPIFFQHGNGEHRPREDSDISPDSAVEDEAPSHGSEEAPHDDFYQSLNMAATDIRNNKKNSPLESHHRPISDATELDREICREHEFANAFNEMSHQDALHGGGSSIRNNPSSNSFNRDSKIEPDEEDDFYQALTSSSNPSNAQEKQPSPEDQATGPSSDGKPPVVAMNHLDLDLDDDDDFLDDDDDDNAAPQHHSTENHDFLSEPQQNLQDPNQSEQSAHDASGLSFLDSDEDLLPDDEPNQADLGHVSQPQQDLTSAGEKTLGAPLDTTAHPTLKPRPSIAEFHTEQKGFDLPLEILPQRRPKHQAPRVISRTGTPSASDARGHSVPVAPPASIPPPGSTQSPQLASAQVSPRTISRPPPQSARAPSRSQRAPSASSKYAPPATQASQVNTPPPPFIPPAPNPFSQQQASSGIPQPAHPQLQGAASTGVPVPGLQQPVSDSTPPTQQRNELHRAANPDPFGFPGMQKNDIPPRRAAPSRGSIPALTGQPPSHPDATPAAAANLAPQPQRPPVAQAPIPPPAYVRKSTPARAARSTSGAPVSSGFNASLGPVGPSAALPSADVHATMNRMNSHPPLVDVAAPAPATGMPYDSDASIAPPSFNEPTVQQPPMRNLYTPSPNPQGTGDVSSRHISPAAASLLPSDGSLLGASAGEVHPENLSRSPLHSVNPAAAAQEEDASIVAAVSPSAITKLPIPLLGPKGPVKNKKKDIEKWIDERVLEQGALPGTLLYKLLRQIVTLEPAKRGPAICKILEEYRSNLRLETTTLPVASGSGDVAASMFNELATGDRELAFKSALDHRAYSHALLLAHSLGSEQWQTAVEEFVAEEARKAAAPLAFIYRALAAENAEAGRSSIAELKPRGETSLVDFDKVDSYLVHWAGCVAALYDSSKGVGNNAGAAAGSSAAIEELGKLLVQRGMTEEGHACFVLCGIPLGSIAEFTFPLISGNEPPSFDSYVLAEIYEFTLGHGSPMLLPYKLNFANLLAEAGFSNVGLRVAETVSQVLKSTKNAPPQLVEAASLTVERCSSTASPPSGGWLQRKLSRPNLEKAWVSSFNKFVSGEDDEQPSDPQPNGNNSGAPPQRPSSADAMGVDNGQLRPNFEFAPPQRQSYTPGPEWRSTSPALSPGQTRPKSSAAPSRPAPVAEVDEEYGKSGTPGSQGYPNQNLLHDPHSVGVHRLQPQRQPSYLAPQPSASMVGQSLHSLQGAGSQQNTSQQTIPAQAHLQQPYSQQPYPQQSYPQQVYPQQSHPQQVYSQQPHPQQAYAQQPHPQQVYAQQQPHPPQVYLQQPYTQQDYPQTSTPYDSQPQPVGENDFNSQNHIGSSHIIAGDAANVPVSSGAAGSGYTPSNAGPDVNAFRPSQSPSPYMAGTPTPAVQSLNADNIDMRGSPQYQQQIPKNESQAVESQSPAGPSSDSADAKGESVSKGSDKDEGKGKDDQSKKRGWFSWLKKEDPNAQKPIEVKLGSSTEMYFDKELNRWVQKGGPKPEPKKGPPPPPKKSSTAPAPGPQAEVPRPDASQPLLGLAGNVAPNAGPMSSPAPAPAPYSGSGTSVTPNISVPQSPVPSIPSASPAPSGGIDGILAVSAAAGRGKRRPARSRYVGATATGMPQGMPGE